MKKYNAPAVIAALNDMGRVPPAMLLTAAAKGLAMGVAAGLGLAKLFGSDKKIVEWRLPALEPCLVNAETIS